MTKEQIKIGDVVQLKSGGAYMTVQDVSRSEPLITVVWFDEQNQLHRAGLKTDLVEVKQ